MNNTLRDFQRRVKQAGIGAFRHSALEVPVPAVIICGFVRIRGTYELTASHKSLTVSRLYSPDCRLSEPEVFAAQPRGRKSMYLRHGQRVYTA